MPLIKFSTLVSGMSGKSQGSVFATNNSGAYFRNNTSKIKPKTPRNSVRKTSFTSVSQAWKNLSDDEQDAWKAVTSSFIRNNAFGDPVTPSGYQVFMRVNSTRAVVSLPILSVPVEPRSIPEPGEFTIDYPEMYQFNPSFFTASYFFGYAGTIIPIKSAGYWVEQPVLDGRFMSFRMNCTEFTEGDILLPEPLRILQVVDEDGFGITFTLRSVGNGGFLAELVQNCSGGSWKVTVNLDSSYLKEDIHWGIYLDDTTGLDSELYMAGQVLTSVKTTTGTPVITDITADLQFGVIGSGFISTFLLSDFRYWFELPDSDDIALVAKGYVIGTEAAIVGFNTQEGVTFPNATIETPAYNFHIGAGLQRFQLPTPHSALLLPEITLSVENTGLEGLVLNIYSTPPISTGRSGNQSSYKLVGSYPWDDVLTFNLVAGLKALYGNIPGNSQVLFKIDILDTTTGVISGPSSQVKKKKPRFKAGAEISNTVN